MLGVTGGIGAGKTTVAGLLQARGARVLDADAIVRGLYAGGDLPPRVARRFGPDVLQPDGSVDRPALARRVFGDAAARADLEAIVHPAVRAEVLARLDEWRGEGFDGIVVLDAALLVESRFAYPLDALLVVTAPLELRLERLARRGVPAQEARARIAAQAGDDDKVARADHVISNGGDLAALAGEVDRVLSELGRDGGTRSG
ncbi:MAG: dephospho-CoA kinase [Candidatus Eiseniibacteriota bacterium]